MKTANDPIDSNRPFLTRLGLRIVAIISGCVAAALLAYLIMLPVMLIGIKLGPGLGSTAWGLGIFAGYIVYRQLCKRFKLTLRSKSGVDALFEKEENEVDNSASALYEGDSEKATDGNALMENVNIAEGGNATEAASVIMEEVTMNESEITDTEDSIAEEVEVTQSEEQIQRGEEVSTNTNAFDYKEVNSVNAITESDENESNKAPKRRNTKRIKKICIIIASIILATGLFFVYLSFHTKAEHEKLVQAIKEKMTNGPVKRHELEETISLLKHCDESRFYCYYDHSQAIEELLDLYIQDIIDYCKTNVDQSDVIARAMFKWDGTDLGRYCDEYYKGEKSKNSDIYSDVFVHNYAIIAIKILQYAAEQGANETPLPVSASSKGDPDAQFTLGCYYNGADFSTEENDWNNYTMLGNSVDNKKAAYWYLQAAEQGHRQAMGNLGNAYMNGKGVTRNEEKGVYWIKRAANLGSSFYQCRLGDYYRDGVYVRIGSHEEYETDLRGRYIQDPIFGGYKKIIVDDYDYTQAIIPKDIEQAKYWWKLAAENGNETAKERLQQIYD